MADRHITLRPTFQGGSPITSILEPELTSLYEELFGNPYMQKGKPFQVGAEVSVAF
jgi:hypothetical protein